MNALATRAVFDQVLRLAKQGDLRKASSIIASEPTVVRFRDAEGDTLLAHAIDSTDSGFATLLLDMGASPNDQNSGSSYLHDAIDSRPGGDIELVQLLLDRGANIETRGINDWTPLHKACRRGYIDLVRLLLSRGASIDARTRIDHHETPLMEAASAGRDDIVRLLLDRGADPTLVDLAGKTPEQIADVEGHPEVVAAFQDWRVRQASGQ
jgi:ankyrin repeat protein